MAYTTIKKPSDYFNTVTYTGNTSAGHAITGVGFQPDLTWNKSRANATPHYLFDVIRGATNFIKSDSTSAESQNTDTLTSFDSDGFTLGNATGNNGSGSFASWNWKANGAGSANTDGSISSTVSANTTSGFSIVSYTGTGANATVGHGLGVAPSVIIAKGRSTTYDWVYGGNNIGGWGNFLRLNTTAASDSASTVWNNTAPTSSVFDLGSNAAVNEDDATQIAYCFAEKQGFSKFGSYTGNGSASSGTFVYTGFKPAFVMVKASSAGGTYNHWGIMDNKRANSFNVIDAQLCANISSAENDPSDIGNQLIDFLSNGFKPRNNGSSHNSSGVTYIYMAFAEEPLVGDNPATAR